MYFLMKGGGHGDGLSFAESLLASQAMVELEAMGRALRILFFCGICKSD